VGAVAADERKRLLGRKRVEAAGAVHVDVPAAKRVAGLSPNAPAAEVRADHGELRERVQHPEQPIMVRVIKPPVAGMGEERHPALDDVIQLEKARIVQRGPLHVGVDLDAPKPQRQRALDLARHVRLVGVDGGEAIDVLVLAANPRDKAVDGGRLRRRRRYRVDDAAVDAGGPFGAEQTLQRAVKLDGQAVKPADVVARLSGDGVRKDVGMKVDDHRDPPFRLFSVYARENPRINGNWVVFWVEF